MTSRNPFLAAKRRPVVVGHRGVPRLHQENSLAGFRRAVELGIPAVELDVQLTADGRPVVVHDEHLGRLTGRNALVRDLTWDQLSRLRVRRVLPMGVGSDGGKVVARYEREEPIPLLAEVLAEVADDVAINIELKMDMPRWWHVDIGAIVARTIAAAGACDRVIVTSFDPRKLTAARRALADLACGFCFDDGMFDFARPLLRHRTRPALCRLLETHLIGRFFGQRVVGAEHTLVGVATVERLHRLGVAVGTHTLFPLGSTTGKPIDPAAATEREVERLVALGVDWIESDDPERLLACVERAGR